MTNLDKLFFLRLILTTIGELKKHTLLFVLYVCKN